MYLSISLSLLLTSSSRMESSPVNQLSAPSGSAATLQLWPSKFLIVCFLMCFSSTYIFAECTRSYMLILGVALFVFTHYYPRHPYCMWMGRLMWIYSGEISPGHVWPSIVQRLWAGRHRAQRYNWYSLSHSRNANKCIFQNVGVLL